MLMSLFRIFVNQLEEDDEEMVSLDSYESVIQIDDGVLEKLNLDAIFWPILIVASHRLLQRK